MSNKKSMCYKCVRFRSDYNTGSISCRCHGFYPDRPHTMPKSCRNYEYDERKENACDGFKFRIVEIEESEAVY